MLSRAVQVYLCLCDLFLGCALALKQSRVMYIIDSEVSLMSSKLLIEMTVGLVLFTLESSDGVLGTRLRYFLEMFK